MPAPKRPENHLNTEEIHQKLKSAESKSQYRKWLAVWLSWSQGICRKKIAGIIGVSTSAVINWLTAYDLHGPDGLKSRTHLRGRKPFMEPEKEQEILEEFKSKAENGELVTAAQIRSELSRQLDRPVSAGYPYRVLKRCGWRKIKPRPVHPKADKEAQEELKKTSKAVYWKPPESSTKTTKGRSG